MTIVSMFLNGWALILVMIGLGERAHLQHLVEHSKQIAVGASQEQVFALLGEPVSRFEPRYGLSSLIFGARPAQWAYGPIIDFESFTAEEIPAPSPLPINLRLFSAAEKDLVINWTVEKRVSNVQRPGKQLPDEFVKGVSFVTTWARRLANIQPLADQELR